MEITATENKEKRMKKKKKKPEEILRDFCDNIKHTNICIIEIPGGEERENI